MWNRESDFQDSFARMYPEFAPPRNYYADGTEKTRLATRNVTIVVTEQCNLRCTYCYQHNKNNTRMTKERAKEIVDILFEEDAKNNQFINEIDARALILDFIGGEPLLEIDLIDYFMRYFRKRAVELNHRWAIHHMISISTNGILYNTPRVQEFVKKNQGRLSLTITIDGNKELHDSCRLFPDGSPSYDIVEKSVKNYLMVNPYSSTKLTLAPANVAHTYGAIRHLFEEIKLPTVFANCVYEEGWTNADATTLYYQLKQLADWILENNREQHNYCSLFDSEIGRAMKPEENNNWCGGDGSMISFTPDGYAQPCLRYTHFNLNDKQPELRIGDVKTGIANLQEYKDTLAELGKITRRSQSTDECFNCPIAQGCSWCTAYNYEVTGSPNKRVTFICPMHKARVMANRYFWQRLYKKHNMNDEFPLTIPKEWALEIIPEDEYQMLMDLK